MPIRITVPFQEKDTVKQLGARWAGDLKTWYIPNTIENINPFSKWLPKDEGYIVEQTCIVAQSSRSCWKCDRVTPLIALGAKSFYSLEYTGEDSTEWIFRECPVFFMNILYMDEEVWSLLHSQFPFFYFKYSHTVRDKYWANNCLHCNSIQGDFYNFMEPDAAFSPLNPEGAKMIRIGYIKLSFDYYLQAGIFHAESNEWIIR